ncbi:cytoplasmic polyadenylation element-binding protein 2 isoform X2 [Brachyhypopomus gauderio]|uniref:cytoplasmic polyadenylation element-binding protein 2 isoform X2 n=1 Tax=Brachyhypopomus gauderio TaxID=698409 RepID=UPI0040432855
MGDYGFGLLQTASISSSATLFGGGAFRSYSTPSPVTADRFSPTSPLGSESAPFSSAVHQQNMQDEPVRLTASHQLPPTVQNNDSGNAAEHPQPSGTNTGHNRPDLQAQDHDALGRFADFKAGGQAQFCPTQSFCDLQHDRKIQRHLSQHPDPDRQEPAPPPPPPLGEFCHLPQKQPYTALCAAEPHLTAGHGHANGPLLEDDTAADAVSSPSPTSVSPRKVQVQMDSPNAHLINTNGTATNSMLAGGIGAGFPNLPHQEMQNPGGGSASPTLPGFGTPWSVQTSSPPPPVSSSANPSHANAMNAAPSTEPDTTFYPGIPSSINPGFFQSFPPVSGVNVQGFSSAFSPQINVPPQQNRRSPVSPQMHPQQGAFLQQRNNYNHHQPMMKQALWGGPQGSGWNSGGVSWGRDHRRGGGMSMPGSLSQVSPMKKPFSSNVIAPPKYPRSASALGPKSWIEETVFRTDNNCNTLLPLQDRSRMFDSLNMHSLESSLIDIIRAEQDPLKGRMGCPHPGADGLLMLNARSFGRRRGRSSLFPIDDGLLDDGHGNQGVPGLLGSSSYPHHNGERIERFSRKVFVGGLPPDIDEDEITSSFRRFGHLVVDWPHKAESKSYFPPKGYAFLLFQEESSVQALIEACLEEDNKLYLCVSSPTIKDKPVQIRPWNLSDSDFVMDGSQPLDPRKTIFVGGVPRPLRAVELAMIMDRLYGGVCYAGIDTDPELKYPKGAGRVAFSNQQSYIAAISARFVQLQHGDIDKRVEVKPYVLDDQLCDECQGARCGGKFAPFFCANVTCLQYYCEFCWANIHSRAGREFHKPLVKEGADRPRQIHFRWN